MLFVAFTTLLLFYAIITTLEDRAKSALLTQARIVRQCYQHGAAG